MQHITALTMLIATAAVLGLANAAQAQQGPAQLWALGGDDLWAFDETGPLNTGTLEFTAVAGGSFPEVEYTGSSWVIVEQSNGLMEVWDAISKTLVLSVAADYSASTIGANSITAMETIGGSLYAAASVAGSSSTAGSEFGTLDPTTGVFTPIGHTGGTKPISGMAYDGTTLYAVTGGGTDSPLFSINLLTGAASDLGLLIVDGGSGSKFTDVEFGADGLLYAVEIDDTTSLGIIDIDTLGFTTIDGFVNLGGVTGITSTHIVPEPASAAMIAIGGLALLRRRRRITA